MIAIALIVKPIDPESMTVIEEDAGRGIAARAIEDLMVAVVGEVSGKVMAKIIAGLYFRNKKQFILKNPPSTL